MLADVPPESLELMDEEVLKSHIIGMSREDGDDFKESVCDWMCRKDADRGHKLLSCGIIIVAELQKQVLKQTEFTCSAGIAHNKMLAKLASGMNKPAQQTVVSYSAVQEITQFLANKEDVYQTTKAFVEDMLLMSYSTRCTMVGFFLSRPVLK